MVSLSVSAMLAGGMAAYVLLGSASMGYIMMRTGWPKIRQISPEYKSGWSIIFGLGVALSISALSAGIAYLSPIGFLASAPVVFLTMASLISFSGIGVFTMHRKYFGGHKVRVSVPKRVVTASIAAKMAVEKMPKGSFEKASSIPAAYYGGQIGFKESTEEGISFLTSEPQGIGKKTTQALEELKVSPEIDKEMIEKIIEKQRLEARGKIKMGEEATGQKPAAKKTGVAPKPAAIEALEKKAPAAAAMPVKAITEPGLLLQAPPKQPGMLEFLFGKHGTAKAEPQKKKDEIEKAGQAMAKKEAIAVQKIAAAQGKAMEKQIAIEATEKKAFPAPQTFGAVLPQAKEKTAQAIAMTARPAPKPGPLDTNQLVIDTSEISEIKRRKQEEAARAKAETSGKKPSFFGAIIGRQKPAQQKPTEQAILPAIPADGKALTSEKLERLRQKLGEFDRKKEMPIGELLTEKPVGKGAISRELEVQAEQEWRKKVAKESVDEIIARIEKQRIERESRIVKEEKTAERVRESVSFIKEELKEKLGFEPKREVEEAASASSTMPKSAKLLKELLSG